MVWIWHFKSLKNVDSRTKLPMVITRKPMSPGQQRDACDLEVDRLRRRHETARRTGPFSRARLRVGGAQSAGRNGRDVHAAEAETSAFVMQVPGHDQRYRESAEWRSEAHEQCDSMARRGHGRTMGSLRLVTHRKAFPEGHRSSGLLDSRRHSRTRKNI